MKATITLVLLGVASHTFAQLPEDILRYSFYPQVGTARSLAIGGAMGSLGGDISSTFTNPAGLGLYKTRELVLTPGMGFNSNHNDFRGTNATSSLNRFQLGTSGFVFGAPTQVPNTKWRGSAFSIAVTKVSDFNNHSYYRGLNNYSSYADQYADDANQSGQSIDGILNDPSFAYGTSLALGTYLIDTVTNGSGQQQYVGLPDFLLNEKIPLIQEKTVDSRGGMSEVDVAFAASHMDKWYIGGALGFPIVYVNQTIHYTETASSPDPSGNFVSSSFYDNRISKGYGVNLRLGVIFKPDNSLRLGAAFTSPSVIGTTDTHNATMTTNTGSYAGTQTAQASDYLGNASSSNNYTLITPWRALLSASYVFNAVEDVKQQRGFVTADLEYVGYHESGFGSTASSDDDPTWGSTPAQNAYYHTLTQLVHSQYKDAVNLKVGGELKLDTWLARLGFAHYGNPHRDNDDLKAGKTIFSAGLGYRNFGMFFDVGYAYAIATDVDFPYLVSSKENTFADLRDHRGTLMITWGVKF
jgi:hypothetical protein